MSATLDFIADVFKENKKDIIIIIAISVIGSLLAVLVPYIYGRLFDLAIVPNSPLNLVLLLIFLWFSVSMISNFISNRVASRGDLLGVKIPLNSEYNAYSHFFHLPISFHKKAVRGDVLQRISRASWTLQGTIELFSSVLPQFLILLFSVIAMIWLQWQLASVVIFSFIIYTLVTVIKMRQLVRLHEKEDRIYSTQYGKVYDKLYNVFLVKNFAMEETERKNVKRDLVDRLTNVSGNVIRKVNELSLIQDMIYTTSFVSVLGLAILFLRAELLSPGEFVMFFGYTTLAFAPFRHIAAIYRNMRRASVSIKRLEKLKRIVPEKMNHGNLTLKDPKGEVEFGEISFGYSKDKKILKNINLKIKQGETIALVGKSGVGKTTLSELIMGYYKPEKGKIRFDGVDISRLKLEWLRDQIAIVPQDLNLFNDTILNNLKYANPKATKKDVVQATRAAFIHGFIIGLPKGYNTMVGEKGLRLSMGQKQRLAIAMAFLKNPKILILDEPTSALDAESEKMVQEGIEKLIKGRTTIIIAHRFSTVRKASKIIVLNKGEIAEMGNHRELMAKKGIYQTLYALQKGID